MRIGVCGLGYVGCVSAVCLASQGCHVIGVDVNADKVDLLGRGLAPIFEERIGDMTAEVIAAGTLTVTTEERDANTPIRDAGSDAQFYYGLKIGR